MPNRLIVGVKTLRQAGWPLPRHRIAFLPEHRGVLEMRESQDPVLGRYTKVARLLEVRTGAAIAEVAPLLDAVWLRATGDEWIIGGLERSSDGLNPHDVAQTWLVLPIALEAIAD